MYLKISLSFLLSLNEETTAKIKYVITSASHRNNIVLENAPRIKPNILSATKAAGTKCLNEAVRPCFCITLTFQKPYWKYCLQSLVNELLA